MTAATTWLASYPKSGNTWLRVLLDNWSASSAVPVDINNLSAQEWSPNSPSRFESATLLSPDVLLPAEVEELRGPANRLIASEIHRPAVVKIHNGFTPGLGAGVAHSVVYVVRDPRDVVPSLAAHLGISIDAAINKLNSPSTALSPPDQRRRRQLPQSLGDWSGHVRGWLDMSGLPLHLVRYEDLPDAFEGVLRFLGKPHDPVRIKQAIHHSRLEELQRQEAAQGFKERFSAEPFFRQGKAGSWRLVLTPDQTRRIESAHGPTMHRLGYLPARAIAASGCQ
jgi:aryl sulfotransferase